MEPILLDARCLSREQAQSYLSQTLPLPGYYGRNLDALHDCLTEAAEMTLAVEHIDQAPPYFERVRQVLLDAAAENPGLQVDWYAGSAPRLPADAPEWSLGF